MKKHIKLLLGIVTLALVAGSWSGCHRTFDEPEPLPIFTEQDIINDGYEFVTINELKQIYYDEFDTGTIGMGITIDDKIAIRGKVISNDRYGNIYKSLYLQDVDGGEFGAIEIKVGATSLYSMYQVGRVIFVKADGLILGNYRYNLSLGGPSNDDTYANGNIDVRAVIDRHILRGRMSTLTANDTLVVDDFSQLRDPQDLNRLVRFNNLTSVWGKGEGYGYSETDIYPSFLKSIIIDRITEYTNYSYVEVIEEWQAYEADPENVPMPTSPRPGLGASVQPFPSWGFKNPTYSYYGSCLFRQSNNYYVVRSSGYARFALDPVPADGEVTDITAILGKYSSRTGGYVKYQLLLNNVNDVELR